MHLSPWRRPSRRSLRTRTTGDHRHLPARPGETADQAKARGAADFAALQTSPFFDLWASAGVDEILSALHEKLVVGDR